MPIKGVSAAIVLLSKAISPASFIAQVIARMWSKMLYMNIVGALSAYPSFLVPLFRQSPYDYELMRSTHPAVE